MCILTYQWGMTVKGLVYCDDCFRDAPTIRVWRYQRGNLQNIIHKTKDRVTRTPLKDRGKLRYSGRVISSCSTSGTRRVTLGTTPSISLEWGKHFIRRIMVLYPVMNAKPKTQLAEFISYLIPLNYVFKAVWAIFYPS